ncbi:MAG TPA: glycosyltransferase [Saprospiraceae bacterium]|nr:glycosyltransferase [Saprospiraceae bacterium]HMQ85143.1 glycosyltransferase [Saprospiraceae bacterium]
MLSILLPIYNYDVRPLVQVLQSQAQHLQVPWEIICLDDASAPAYRDLNREIDRLSGVQYEVLSENIGRARIRNALAQRARLEYLLFMDCDSGVVNDDFLATYGAHLQPNTVLCGGTAYAENAPSQPELNLHWKYGRRREQISADRRRQSPYQSFKTHHFVVPKPLMLRFPFEERLTQYGHEDTLFGLALEKAHIPIVHLDNPMLHLGLEPRAIFLEKTKRAIENLVFLQEQGIAIETRLLNVYQGLQRWKMAALAAWLLKRLNPVLVWLLYRPNPPIRALDLYKLSYLLQCAKKNGINEK